MLFVNLWFHSCAVYTAFVLMVLVISMWNCASYNFHLFAPKYMQVRAWASCVKHPASSQSSYHMSHMQLQVRILLLVEHRSTPNAPAAEETKSS